MLSGMRHASSSHSLSGGPGGSGVAFIGFIPALAEAFQGFVGDEYDIVGFDPRGTPVILAYAIHDTCLTMVFSGIGFTTPGMFASESIHEELFLTYKATDNLNQSSTSLYSLYGHAQIIGNIAVERLDGIAQYVGTPTVARDMMSIVKAFGRDKLQYWGFS